MLYLDNLVSTVVHQGKPWEFKGTIPAGVVDKAKRTTWITNPGTKHSVYTAWEGVASNLRINDPKGSSEGNPPLKLWGLVADYDAKVGPEEIAKGLERLRIKPNWTSTSLSGYCHAVWLFEAPIMIPNREWAKPFLEHIMAEMDLEGFLPRFDKKAFLTPDRYYTNSLNWTEVHAEPVPSALVTGWSMQVSQMFNWDNEGTAVPLDEVEKELIKIHGESFWPGDWTEGSQGPTFWVTGSVSPKSAIIRATGMQTFASHATKAFYPWADLVGSAFVKEYETKLMGRAVEGISFDGRQFIRKTPSGQWLFQNKEDLKDHLFEARHLSPVGKKGRPSEAVRAVEYIRNHNFVYRALPRAFQKPGIDIINGRRYLNTFTGTAMVPAEGTHVWGPDGTFPWLSACLEKVFPDEQLDFIRSWLHRLYTGCLNHNLESNLALFIAGPSNIGKTFFGNTIVGRMVGGFEDAQGYLAQGCSFNSELFHVALWCVDDAVASNSPGSHRRFSETLKKATANQDLTTHEKFKTPGTTKWQGGIIVTCNDDPESIRMIPDLNGSILDKLALLRTSQTGVKFESKARMDKILADELPAFCAYIRAFEIPEKWIGDARFGVKPYHHPDLVATAQKSSHGAGFAEILEAWCEAYFEDEGKGQAYWEGTAFKLHKSLVAIVGQGSAGNIGLRPLEVNARLSGLHARSYPGLKIVEDDKQNRTFRIACPESLSPKPPKKKTPTKKGPSRYDKQ